MKLRIILSVYVMLQVATAQAETWNPRVADHIKGFVALNCSDLKVEDLKVVREKAFHVDQTIYDYRYDMEVVLENGEVGSLVAWDLSISSFRYANIRLEEVVLPASCSQESGPSVLTLSCGDHWHNFQMTWSISENKASFSYSGDGHRGIEAETTRINLAADGTVEAYLTMGRLWLTREGQDWTARVTFRNGTETEFPSCR